jgi:hypothetical protein
LFQWTPLPYQRLDTDPVLELEDFAQTLARRAPHTLNGERSAPCKDIDTLLGSMLDIKKLACESAEV